METILRSFVKQRKQFLQANDKLHEGVGLSTKNIRSHRDHQAHELAIEDQKDVLVGDIESYLHLQAIIFLHQLVILKDT